MSDAEIVREMNLVRSTIHEHWKRSLKLLKQIMEVNSDVKNERQIDESELLSFHIIQATSEGYVEAINVVLKHYEGYITSLSTRMLFDEYGQAYYCVDETLRRRLETKLITKILDFDQVPYGTGNRTR